jgi:hypothetical protein
VSLNILRWQEQVQPGGRERGAVQRGGARLHRPQQLLPGRGAHRHPAAHSAREAGRNPGVGGKYGQGRRVPYSLLAGRTPHPQVMLVHTGSYRGRAAKTDYLRDIGVY